MDQTVSPVLIQKLPWSYDLCGKHAALMNCHSSSSEKIVFVFRHIFYPIEQTVMCHNEGEWSHLPTAKEKPISKPDLGLPINDDLNIIGPWWMSPSCLPYFFRSSEAVAKTKRYITGFIGYLNLWESLTLLWENYWFLVRDFFFQWTQ